MRNKLSWGLLSMLPPEAMRWPGQRLLDRDNYSSEQISMGPYSYGQPLRVRRSGPDPSWVRIGNFCSIAYGVVFMEGGNHRTEWVSTFPFRAVLGLPEAYLDGHPYDKGDVIVGHDVWIGREARISSGVTIGHGAVVAGYSVVTKDVRPYSIVAGSPAREKRRRFTDEQVHALLEIAWWDWPDEQIRKYVPALNGATVDDFIEEFSPRSDFGGT